ncbi:MAG: hypothetical protein L0219_04850 [Phycisphaerales bacterium]|nr:hypothetical protein [Phycisphaerales bacterium]
MYSRLKKFWDGALRGARFGATVGLIIAVAINVLALCVILFDPASRDRMRDDFDTTWEAVSNIAGTFIGAGLVVMYSALTGAVVMGIARILRADQTDLPEAK